MIAANFNKTCSEVEPYYFDLLDQEAIATIPADIITHYNVCSHCQAETQRLNDCVSNERHLSDHDSEKTQTLTRTLQLQFSFIGKDIDCQTAKPFLPLLAIPEMKTSIATPITSHLEHCENCLSDLEKLQRLHLSQTMAIRLSSLFSQKIPINQSFIQAAKQTLFSDDLPEDKALLSIANEIYHREPSGVVTRFTAENTSEHSDELPYDIQLLTPKQTVSANTDSDIQQNTNKQNLILPDNNNRTTKTPKWIKPFAAAAVLLIVFGLFMFNSQNLTAFEHNELAEAIKKANNIHIKEYFGDNNKLNQETWASRTLSKYVMIDHKRQQAGVFDLINRTRIVNDFNSNKILTTPLSQAANTDIQNIFTSQFYLIPLGEHGRLPENASIEKLQTKTNAPDLDIYKLEWKTSINSNTTHYKRLWYISQQNNLVMKTETFRKDMVVDAIETPTFKLISLTTYDYVNQQDVTNALNRITAINNPMPNTN